MKSYHFLFGYIRPQYTTHFLQRYAERFYNVKKEDAVNWINFHKKRLEITQRLYKAELYDEKNASKIREKYGGSLRFLRYKRVIFVIRDNRAIVTCYKLDK